ncbi:MAG TPA: hypothetical protein VFI28_13100 [Candidatus Limnocylindrales bacterium]|nr:hypothetical protein [Candidatus Limnocylindrales bacterium]
MDQTLLLAIVVAAAVGILAILLILRRDRRTVAAGPVESPFAISTEGEKRCSACGMGNLWTSRTCASCGSPLAG